MSHVRRDSFDETDSSISKPLVEITEKNPLKKIKKYHTKNKIVTKKKNTFQFTILITSIISYVCYYLSLGGCHGTQVECLQNSNIGFYYYLMNYCLISAVFYILSFYMILLKLASKWHIIHLILVMLFLFISDTGTSLFSHGLYNIIGFIFISFFMTILIAIVIIINEILRRKNFFQNFITINIILGSLIILRYLYLKKLSASCEGWDIGLNDVPIKDDKTQPCQIIRPEICHLTYFDKLLDFSKMLKINCAEKSNFNRELDSRGVLINYINKPKLKNTKRFGFPITTNKLFEVNSKTTPHTFSKLVMDNVLDMDKLPKNLPKSKYPEVTLEFTETNKNKKKKNYIGKINININYNEELSIKRKSIENPGSLFENVLLIYLDAVSRVQFKRKLPKTSKFITQLLKNKYNEKDTIENKINNYYGYQFMKFHAFASNTFPNAFSMFYGFGNNIYTNIIQDFKKAGFITAHSVDMCSKEVWEPEKEPNDIIFNTWDHENIAMFCDPSYIDRDSMYSIFKGAYSLLKRCFYGKEIHDYIFEYGKKFWETYIGNRKFLRLAFNDGHESSFEVIQYIDDALYNFLNFFYENGYLRNTGLFILSDHGNHMPGLYNLLFAEQYEIERVLPFLFIIVNSKELFVNKLKRRWFHDMNFYATFNQQIFITSYDIHSTLKHIITASKHSTDKGSSLFSLLSINDRVCSKFSEIRIEEKQEKEGMCRCILNAKYEKFVYYNNTNNTV